MQPTKVFVYGTLKKGRGNYDWCIKPYLKQGIDFVQENKIPKGDWRMLSLGGFPGVVPAIDPEQSTEIVGEIFEVTDDAVMRGLDQLEGYPDFYDKAEIVVGDETVIMYVLDPEEYKEPYYEQVADGVW
jgi:gamma-glutamylcyclotransferase (GGCT)/AIG2-like uncharacterized protein YtfP